MTLSARRALLIVALLFAVLGALGYPPGVPLLVVAVILLAVERLL